ncbi:glycosyltransferase family 59 protein [Patellaria atrata CBS 101060]|uniref:Dol-P-Glc:Glc(2)Man(9)GlcNAc(2)-PP-Dol alpha-1,2-glucosyltransferase n=1 Tax=Patellaria atrata CBS 101060 TaxID=1346257 RepID=A0A9P4VR72_9PEZI|nr:glycosyltransferase family 59 protein [Patellaria atrata CBS 101060]
MAGNRILPLAIVGSTIAILSGQWLRLVSRTVPGPYLDEVFHVRQAQLYCKGNFSFWDPKITTPPGLYLISYLVALVTGHCSILALRAVNCYELVCVAVLSLAIWRILKPNAKGGLDGVHDAINIALFPPLFFFSGLYYTDVFSTASALLTYKQFLDSDTTSNTLDMIVSGIIALLCRQTNVFWVAVFPAGLGVVRKLRGLGPQNRIWWEARTLYEKGAGDAWVEDYVSIACALAIAALASFGPILRAIAPQLILLSLFGAFVVWNGGVVLGDKSNHVATVHLPQILYIWPYITFFSWPLILNSILIPFLTAFTSNTPPREAIIRAVKPPRISTIVIFTTVALATIHWNTIIHPFTLADNRHYIFYIFRLLRLHPTLLYAAAPIYTLSAHLVLSSLSGPSTSPSPPANPVPINCKPLPAPPPSTTASPMPTTTSFALILLGTTALSLVTAPLVEPRYFIIPWLLWRLHLPPQTRGALVLETLWMGAVNVATVYVFLYRGFEWPQEPGKVQRFLW